MALISPTILLGISIALPTAYTSEQVLCAVTYV